MDIIERIIQIFTHWPPDLSGMLVIGDPAGSQKPTSILLPVVTEPVATGSLDKAEETVMKLPDPGSYRRWRLTQYYVSSETQGAPTTVPVLDKNGSKIGAASVAFFSSLSLEGSGILADGRLVNVVGKFVPCDPDDYAAVWEYHKKHLSKRPPGYSGLQIENDRVTKVQAYHLVPSNEVGKGFGICHSVPMDPFRTLAADIGATSRDDPRYRGKGGLVPVGTKIHVRELVGLHLPDGTVHNGWCMVNDTGGGIFGAHFDVFVGYRKDETSQIPEQAHIWFDGIEDRVAADYEYGLHDV